MDPEISGDMRDRTAALQRQTDATLEQLYRGTSSLST